MTAPRAREKTMTAGVGTPLFCAPELLRMAAGTRYDEAVDVWAAGCVLVGLAMHSRLPYSDEDCASANLLSRIASGDARPTLEHEHVLSSCVAACCEYESKDRVSAAELAHALDGLSFRRRRRSSDGATAATRPKTE